MNELNIINKYLKKLTSQKKDKLKLSDDVFKYENKICITVDTYVEGIHFFNKAKIKEIISKVFRSSISDLICKNVDPHFYFLSLAIDKKNVAKNKIEKIYKCFKFEQKKFNCFLAGGDIVKSPKFTITIIFIGKYKKKMFTRSGALPGHDIYVTGELGDADVGLNILKKNINLRKNNNFFIKKFYYPVIQKNFVGSFDNLISSSIDISDGLTKDINHIMANSKVGAIIDLNLIPVSYNFLSQVRKNKIKTQNHVFAGDDYQVLFTAAKKYRYKINYLSLKKGIKITRIGNVTRRRKLLFLLNKKEFKINYKKVGYIHNFK